MRLVVTADKFLHFNERDVPCGEAELREIEMVGSENELRNIWTVDFKNFESFEKFIVKYGPCILRESPDGGYYDVKEERWLLCMQIKRGGV